MQQCDVYPLQWLKNVQCYVMGLSPQLQNPRKHALTPQSSLTCPAARDRLRQAHPAEQWFLGSEEQRVMRFLPTSEWGLASCRGSPVSPGVSDAVIPALAGLYRAEQPSRTSVDSLPAASRPGHRSHMLTQLFVESGPWGSSEPQGSWVLVQPVWPVCQTITHTHIRAGIHTVRELVKAKSLIQCANFTIPKLKKTHSGSLISKCSDCRTVSWAQALAM